MAASLSTELLKLRKRPATWILAAVLIFLIIFFDYFQFYLTVSAIEEEGGQSAAGLGDVNELRDYILPQAVDMNVPGLLSQFGGPVALILGALAAGSEYGWGTLKTSLTQGLGRLSVLGSRILAIAIVLIAFALVVLAVGAAASYVVASLLEADVSWPSAFALLKSIGVTCLIFGAWASLGIFLATLFRGTALAIGIGLVWGVVVESVIFGFSAQSEIMEALTRILLARNGGELANSLGDAPAAFSVPDPGEPWQAALVLALYVLVPLVLTALLLKRRDIS